MTDTSHTTSTDPRDAALDYVIRRLQADIDDGGRPDQWSMADIVRQCHAALAAPTAEPPARDREQCAPTAEPALTEAQIISAARGAGFLITTRRETEQLMRLARAIEAAAKGRP